MTLGKWSDDSKIGEAEIEWEHWGLFSLINDPAEKRARGGQTFRRCHDRGLRRVRGSPFWT